MKQTLTVRMMLNRKLAVYLTHNIKMLNISYKLVVVWVV